MKEDKVGRTCGTHGEGRGVYRVLDGRPEERRPPGRLGVGERITLSWWNLDRDRWVSTMLFCKSMNIQAPCLIHHLFRPISYRPTRLLLGLQWLSLTDVNITEINRFFSLGINIKHPKDEEVIILFLGLAKMVQFCISHTRMVTE
jgi:hypothetical protein